MLKLIPEKAEKFFFKYVLNDKEAFIKDLLSHESEVLRKTYFIILV